jgi:hypothetical protein
MKCPNCGFEEHIDEAEYCQECGTFLINFCSSDMCDMNNGESVHIPENAKFCPFCGSESTFKEKGFFDKE